MTIPPDAIHVMKVHTRSHVPSLVIMIDTCDHGDGGVSEADAWEAINGWIETLGLSVPVGVLPGRPLVVVD